MRREATGVGLEGCPARAFSVSPQPSHIFTTLPAPALIDGRDGDAWAFCIWRFTRAKSANDILSGGHASEHNWEE